MIYHLKSFFLRTKLGLILMSLCFSACNNESNLIKKLEKEEKAFEYMGARYEDWKNINGLFSFNGQDYFNKRYFMIRSKNGYVIISYQGKGIKLKPHEKNVKLDFIEEVYRNDSIKLIISAKPNTTEGTIDTAVYGVKVLYYDAEVQLSVSEKVFVTKAFGSW